MKKCPYCAEKIKNDAIVCRYCGRDLPKEVSPSPEIGNQESKSKSKNVWRQGAKIAAIFTVLAAFGSIAKYQSAPTELIGSLTVGVIVNFLFWWFVVTSLLTLWQKTSTNSWGKPLLIIFFVILLVVCFLSIASLSNGYVLNAFFTSTLTNTPLPSQTPIPINPSTGCPYGYTLISSDESLLPILIKFSEENYCITGQVFSVSPVMNQIRFTESKTELFVYWDNVISISIKTGDCIIAWGTWSGTSNELKLKVTSETINYCP